MTRAKPIHFCTTLETIGSAEFVQKIEEWSYKKEAEQDFYDFLVEYGIEDEEDEEE